MDRGSRKPTKSPSPDSQPVAGFGDARGRAAELAGGHPGQGHELAPAESGTRRGEFLADGPIVLLGVQGAILGNREIQEQVEDRASRLTERADLLSDRAGAAWSWARIAASSWASSVSGWVSLIASRSAPMGRGDQCRKSPPRLTRSWATW